jgi:hypothetical protein
MRARWAGTAAVALAVVAATGSGAGSAAATAAPAEHPNVLPGATSIPAKPSFDYLGKFANVADAPKGTKPIGGTAAMVKTTHATTTSIDATGLDPKSVYVAHVHNQLCATDEGGPHFKFDPNGASAPPNEIWMTPITVSPQGDGSAVTTSQMPANRDAKSVVIHLKRAAGATADEAKPPKLACADLVRVTS